MSFIEAKRTMGAILENPAYCTTMTLTAANYNLPIYNIQYDPQFASYIRKLAKMDYSRHTAIIGKQSFGFTGSVDIAYSGAAATPPAYFLLLQACGMKQTTGGNVVLNPHADYSAVPITVEIQERDEGASPNVLVIRAHGCMGNAKIIQDSVGKPVRVDFDFKGVLNIITDRANASVLVPTAWDTPTPDAVLSATIQLFGEDQRCEKVTIDLGNKIELYTDPKRAAGYIGAHITDREMTIELDPDLEFLVTQGDFARTIGNTTGALSIMIGNHITMAAPAAQYIQTYKPAIREGHVTTQKKLVLTRSTNGNDEFSITHS